MTHAYFKALHLIFVVTWFAGLFYIVRLFIYHTEAHENPKWSLDLKRTFKAQYALMEKRLWYGITWPSALLTTVFGLLQLPAFFPLTDHFWLKIKLILVFFLFLYHFSCELLIRKLKSDVYLATSFQLRIWNEVATVFLIGIVFLAVLKDLLSFVYGLAGLFAIMILLSVAISYYRKIRTGGSNV